MPDLPTITVTQVQADRMIAAYGSVDNYKAWLKDQIIQYVTMVEDRKLFETYVAQRDAKAAEVQTNLS